MPDSSTPGHPSRRARTIIGASLSVLAVAAVTACGAETAVNQTSDGRPTVIAAFYPLQFISERVGGSAVGVTNLAKPGAEPHDLELNPQQVGQIADATLVVYLKGFQPAVDEAVEQNAADRAFDVITAVQPLDASTTAEVGQDTHEQEAGGRDPHVWLDPTRLAAIADQLAQRLTSIDQAHAADYSGRSAMLRSELTTLDREYEEGLRSCQRREIVTSHTAFAYLAERYKLEQIGISGLSPEGEPSAQRLADVAAQAREHGATTIFFETLVSPKTADTIAAEVGARTAVLDPIEGVAGGGGDYFSVMRQNLANLRTALGCS